LASIVLSLTGCFRALASLQVGKSLRQKAEGPGRRLARFLGETTPMQISVDLTKLDHNQETLTEKTVMELGTCDVVLFTSALPLAVDDLVLLRNPGSLLEVSAIVIGMLRQEGRRAVAARILRTSEPTN
jgi:hypothetical protein